MDYEKNIDTLNEIIDKLSNQKMPLEESVKLYEDAQKLYVECSEYLEKQTGKSLFLEIFFLNLKNALRGARTHDRTVKSRTLYRLS